MQPATPRRRIGMLLMVGAIVAAFLTPVSALGASTGGLPAVAGEPDGQVRLLNADAQGVALELVAPAFDVTRDAACQRAEAPGFVLSAEAGRPQVPVKVVLLGVPPDAELDLQVEAAPAATLATGVNLCAAQPVAADADASGDAVDAKELPARDAAIYETDALYPAQPVRLVELGFMRSQRIVRLEFYPVQYNPVAGELRASERITVALRFTGAVQAAAAGWQAEPAEFETAFQRSLLNYESARTFRRSPAANVAAAAAPAAWTPPQPGYKVLVRQEGLYQLTPAALASAGLPVAQLDPRTLRLFNGGQEVALRVTGEADGKFDASDVALFFGQGADTRYTDTNVYWLTYGGATGLRMSTRNSIGGGTAVPSFFASVKREDNLVYDSDLPDDTLAPIAGHDHWWGQQISAIGAGKTGTLNVSLATPELATGAANASVSVLLGGVTAGSHHVRLYINPASHPDSVWNGIWDGPTAHLISATFPQNYLSGTGNNTIRIELINDVSGLAADIVRVDWLRVGYQRTFRTASDQLLFGGDTPGARRYTVDGFSTADVELYDVTDPLRAAVIDWTVEDPSSSSLFLPLTMRSQRPAAAAQAAAVAQPAFTLRFGDKQTTPRRYLAQTPAKRLSPVSITLDQPSNLQSETSGADYIIVTHADFAAAVQPLAAHRATQGLRVRVVDVQDVYDEFGGGLMSAEAIRDFIAHAYANWPRPAPSSVLLVGDGTYDFRYYKNTVPTYVPPYLDMVDPDAGETATDNRFVAVTRGQVGYDILPDLDIGRLPANSAAEVTAMVNKILAYEAQAPAAWMKQVLFVTDDLEGGGGNFYDYSNGIADGYTTYQGGQVKILPQAYTPNKVYLGQTCDLANPATSVECRAQIISQISSGSLMVSYVGHGVKTYWAAEHLYDAAALASVNNPGRLTIMLPMTCNEGYFIDPAETSLSELGVRAENKGAIASWAPTGYGLAPGHDYLERGLFLGVFYDGQTLGRAATAAKLYLVANAPPGQYLDLVDTFLLLGDPALQVP